MQIDPQHKKSTPRTIRHLIPSPQARLQLLYPQGQIMSNLLRLSLT